MTLQDYQRSARQWHSVVMLATKDVQQCARSRSCAAGGQGTMTAAIQCMIAGLEHEASELLSLSDELQMTALSSGERPRIYFEFASEAQLHFDIALRTWLSNSRHDSEHFGEFARYQDKYFAKNKPNKRDGDDIAVEYLTAGRPDRVLEIYNAAASKGASQIKGGKLSPLDLAVHLCMERLDPAKTPIIEPSVLDMFLQKQIPGWLNRGYYLQIATWMKVVFYDREPQCETSSECLTRVQNYFRA